jgi:hypothetical protein
MKMPGGSLPLLLAVAVSTAPVLSAADAPAAPPEPVPAAAAPAAPAASEHHATRDPAEVAADALIVRPISLAATVVGAAAFLVALPFAAIAGDVDATGRALVGAPARYTFKRPLGDFEVRHQ